MADNQRKMQREEKRLKKDRRNKIIIWTLIAVVVIVLAVMRVCEININSVKEHFTDENGKLSISDGVGEDSFPYSVDYTKNVILANVNNRLGVLTPSSFTVINSSNGSCEYTFEHGYSNPVMKASGVYTLVFDQGADSFRLDTTGGAVYEKKSESTLFCGDVSKNGSVAIATASKTKRCDFLVYDNTMNLKFSESVSDGYVISVALSDNGKKLAVAWVDSVNAGLSTTVTVYNVKSGEREAEIKLPQGSMADLRFSGKNIFVVGDSYAGVIKNDRYVDIYKIGEMQTVCFDYTPSGELVLVHNSFDNSTSNVVSIIKSSGKIKTEIKVSGNVKDVSAASSVVTVLTGNKLYSFASANGKEKSATDCDESVNSICRLGSEVFCHRQTNIDKCDGDGN